MGKHGRIMVDKEFEQTLRSVFYQLNNCSVEHCAEAVLPWKGDPGPHLHLAVEEEVPGKNPQQTWFSVPQ